MVNQIVSEILGGDFLIDPEVSGTVTLRTANAVPISELPALLEQSLNLSGVTMIQSSSGIYSILPIEKANRFLAPPQLVTNGPSGNNVVYPLRYVSVENILEMLQPLTPTGTTISGDTHRQQLIVKGQQEQVRTLIDTIKMFDVDWLAEMSFAIFEIEHASAQEKNSTRPLETCLSLPII